MMRVTAITLVPVLFAGQAAADWAFRPSEASDDLGSAYVQNAQGHVLDIGCGNGGEISLQLRANVNANPVGDQLSFVFPGMRGMLSVPFECESGVCGSGYQYGAGQPWTEKQKIFLINALRKAPEVTIHGFIPENSEIATFTLKGSAAALGRLKESTRGCIGL